MEGRPTCQVAGCSGLVTTVLPLAPPGLPSLAQVAAAPMRACCPEHDGLVSDRYAAALDWALLRELDEDLTPECEVIEQICDRLGAMDTPWTRSLFRSLGCTPGPPW